MIILFLLALLFSCGKNTADQENNPVVDQDAVRTEAVSTFASSLTETLVAVPTASSTPTVTPTLTLPAVTATEGTTVPVKTCYNLLYLKDVTIPDNTEMKAGEKFTKTWLVQNNGDCAWAPGFTFNNVGGDPMRGASVVLREPVPVGLKKEISVELVVPSGIKGLIQSSWRMADNLGNYFGDTLSVNITVGSGAAPTATATP
jgi:hypothetical protein